MLIIENITHYDVSKKMIKYNILNQNYDKTLYNNYIRKLNQGLSDNIKIVKLIYAFEVGLTKLLLNSLGFDFRDDKKVGMIRYKSNKYRLFNYKDKDMGDKRLPFLIQNHDKDLWSRIKDVDDYCKREIFLRKYYYDVINLFEVYLEKNGSVFFSFFNDCVNTYTMEIYFILSTLFERVVVLNIRYVYCVNFLGAPKKFLVNNCVDFDGRKQLETKIGQFLLTFHDEYQKCVKLFMKEEYDRYIDSFITLNSEFILKYIDSHKYLELQIRTTKRLFYDSNKIVRVNSNINYNEGNLLKYIITKHNFVKCLEVGLAFGISSNFILSASDKITLVSIDPFQGSQWNDYGLKILRHNGLIDRHRLIREKSYEALPELLKKEKEQFDFIFIDGFHTFDYTLVDVFYSLHLLRKNGIVVIDDVLHNGVSKVIKYIDSNYSTFLKKIDIRDVRTFCAYMKIREDERLWNFHVNF